MKLKDLFEVISKIMGFYLLFSLAISIPQMMSSLVLLFKDGITIESLIYFMIVTGFSIFLYLWFAKLLIFRSEKIIFRIVNNEKLESDFTTFKIHRSVVLSISIIVVGGITLINEIPSLIWRLYDMKIHYDQFNEYSSKQWLIITIIKILIALYIVWYHNFLVSLIEKIRKK